MNNQAPSALIKPKLISKKAGQTLEANRLVVDSLLTETQAIRNDCFPAAAIRKMALVPVTYLGFDGLRHQGQIVVAAELADEVREIFAEVEALQFPIEQVTPISEFGWDDEASMSANNTSAFNYRKVNNPGKKSRKLSLHAYGRALDINPFQNPYITARGSTPGEYDPEAKGTLTADHPVVKLFKSRGWIWGGDWTSGKDYQHFEKPMHPR